jgi:hypothetical protein
LTLLKHFQPLRMDLILYESRTSVLWKYYQSVVTANQRDCSCQQKRAAASEREMTGDDMGDDDGW